MMSLKASRWQCQCQSWNYTVFRKKTPHFVLHYISNNSKWSK